MAGSGRMVGNPETGFGEIQTRTTNGLVARMTLQYAPHACTVYVENPSADTAEKGLTPIQKVVDLNADREAARERNLFVDRPL